MVSTWTRVAVSALPPGAVLQRGGMMMMATTAKKHLTIFARSRRARGAGRVAVKQKFAELARQTGGMPDRMKRNAAIQAGMKSAGLRTNVVLKRSRSKYGPLAGKFYRLSPGETVSAAIARRGLESVLSEGGGMGGGTMGGALGGTL